MSDARAERRPTLMVLASTYPRWRGDPEPAFVHELCRRLARWFDVIAIVPDAPGADPSGTLDGVEVVRYRYAPRSLQRLVNDGGIAANLRRSRWKYLLVPGFVLGQYLAARRILRSRRVDVIHAHWLIPQGVVARRLERRFGVPFLVTSHGGDLFGLRGAALESIKRKVAAAASAMTVVSSAMKSEAERIGLRPASLAVIPMGVDLRERFTPDPTVPRERDHLLFVGRLVPKKGLSHLLAALPRIVQARTSIRLSIAGFGPQESELKAQAARLGLAAHVQFLGAQRQENLPALYRRASLFVAPFVRDQSGDQEGLPVALMEAIGCGCPVLAGDIAGIRDLLGDDALHCCVDPRDPDALVSAVLRLVTETTGEERAIALRQRLVAAVDWDSIADAYARALRQCLPNRPRFAA